MSALKFLPSLKVIVFFTSPSETFVTDPIALILLTSPAKMLPSSVTVTYGLVNSLPSYSLLAVSLVNVTWRLLITNFPSSTINVTFAKFVFLFAKFAASKPIGYSPASVPSAFATPVNLISFSWYNFGLEILTV